MTRIYKRRVKIEFRDFDTKSNIVDADECSNDIISLTTNNAYGRCASLWQILLPYKKVNSTRGYGYYSDILKPDDIIDIYIDSGGGEGFTYVMYGLVDRVSIVRNGGYVVNRSIKISGSDFGKILLKHDVSWDIFQGKLKVAKSVTDEKKDDDIYKIANRLTMPFLYAGTPKFIIEKLYELAFEKALGEAIAKNFKLVTTGSDDKWKTFAANFNSIEGIPIWSALKQFENKPYNVLTADTEEKGAFKIELETLPFDKDTGKVNRDKSRQHTITQSDIISDDVGISDIERINFMFLYPQSMLSTVKLDKEVLMIREDMTKSLKEEIEKHGLCTKTFTTMFMPSCISSATSTIDDNAFKENTSRLDILWNWYSKNHTYESGHVTVGISPWIKIGDMLLIEQEDNSYKQYFVEQVSHMYSCGHQVSATTQLALTRGTPV